MSERAIQKIRGGERGWKYAAKLLEEFGAPPAPDGDKTSWLANWLSRLTRRLPHTGNHKYAWALETQARRLLPRSLAYPKNNRAAVESVVNVGQIGYTEATGTALQTCVPRGYNRQV